MNEKNNYYYEKLVIVRNIFLRIEEKIGFLLQINYKLGSSEF